jgi:SAM-dependent methyltransferase
MLGSLSAFDFLRASVVNRNAILRSKMHWKIKGAIQKILSGVPGGKQLNDRLQLVSGLRNFEGNIADKVGDWTQTCRYLRDVQFAIPGSQVVEVGTGWYPVLPMCFRLAGVGSIKTYDVQRHLNFELTGRALADMEPHLDAIAEFCADSAADVGARYQEMRRAASIDELLRLTGIEYCAPGDARHTGLAANSVDLVYSNSVFEHVPKQAILEILRESQRILKPGGLALHNIGCNDHYAFFDPSISFVNFLRFSEAEWRLWNNSLLYQNRLRAPQFLDMAAQAGLKVIYKRTNVRAGCREALKKFTVAPEFREFPPEDLATTTLDFISQKVA